MVGIASAIEVNFMAFGSHDLLVKEGHPIRLKLK